MIVAAASGGGAFWYLSRGTGAVSLLLLTAAVTLGILNAMRWRSERWPAFVVTGVHRNLTLVALAFIAIHVVTIVADGYAPVHLLDAVLPFASAYRPIWTGLGAVALDLLLALVATSLLRHRIGYRRWRAIHWLAYAAWPVALLHGIGTGTDVRETWMLLLTLGCVGVTVLAVLFRVVGGLDGDWSGRRLAGALGVLALPLALFAWMHAGPLRRGWAARAGTPSSLLAAPASSSDVPSSFTARLSGTISRGESDDGGASVTIDGALSGGFVGRLRLVLLGEQGDDGAVRLSSSTVALGPPAEASELTGQVVELQGTHVLASLADTRGHRLRLGLDLQIDDDSGAVSGVAQATAA